MLKLYYAPRSCSFAAHIALEEAGADFEAIRVNFAVNEQNSATYKKLNPKGRVPLLVTPQGAISENVAILAYIAQTHPSANLAALDDPFAFGQMQAFCAYLAATVHVAHAHKGRGYRWADDPAVIAAMRLKVPHNMSDYFTVIETEFFKGPWVMGNQYTVADPYLYTFAQWLEGDGVDARLFPNVYDHRTRMAARPAVKRSAAAHNAA